MPFMGRWMHVCAVCLMAVMSSACGDSGNGGGSGGGSGGAGSPQSYTVGGTVSGLSGSGLVLQNNDGNDLSVSGNGSFAFSTAIVNGTNYAVSVKTQPSNPTQTCAVSNPSGTISGSNVTNAVVTCTTSAFSVGGTLTGLFGSGLVLQINGGNDLAVSADGSFIFPTSITSGSAYAVTVKTPPAGPIQVCAVTSGSGTIGSANVTGVAVSCGPIALLAGALGGSGSLDGTGANARFKRPRGVATDSAGNLYVADFVNSTIRKITPVGVASTFAGTAGQSGSADGTGSAARFSGPYGIASDSMDNLYVVDSNNNTIRRITPAGVVSTLAGSAGQTGSADGAGANARFKQPLGIATDPSGNLYVTDSGNDTIRKISPGGAVTTLAGTVGQVGSTDGTAAVALFSGPIGIAADSVGNAYVADTNNHTIRKITPAGVVSTLAGTPNMYGSTDGNGAVAQFFYPQGIATDSAGNMYVTDLGNHTIRKIIPAGVVSTLAGMAGQSGSADGTASTARFNGLSGIATDSAGNLYVTDARYHVIRKITPATMVSTLAGMAPQAGTADGSGGAARFNSSIGVAADSAGNVYIADTFNETIRKVTPVGVVSTLAGAAGQTGSADGAGADARFQRPQGVATDPAGNLYVTDTYNETIRKITAAGVVTTLAGTVGQVGSTDGAAAVALFSGPTGIAADSMGNVYVADTNNHTIRKITPAGVVSTLAGTPNMPGSTDGSGAAARFHFPEGIAADSAGNVYVADSANYTIRKITPAGVVSTLAGTPNMPGSADGNGAAAGFASPASLAIDSAGNVYVADTDNNTIRKITPKAVVTTVAGTVGMQGVELGPLPGSLNRPYSVAVLPGPVVKLVETDAENAVLEVVLP
jgi:hypothetical protein